MRARTRSCVLLVGCLRPHQKKKNKHTQIAKITTFSYLFSHFSYLFHLFCILFIRLITTCFCKVARANGNNGRQHLTGAEAATANRRGCTQNTHRIRTNDAMSDDPWKMHRREMPKKTSRFQSNPSTVFPSQNL